jgi:hypothetical protein
LPAEQQLVHVQERALQRRGEGVHRMPARGLAEGEPYVPPDLPFDQFERIRRLTGEPRT